MNKPLRIGLIGLDTSHATAFTGLLNNEQDEHHVPGGRVVAAFPGGSADWALSSSRVKGFSQTLRNDFGVTMHDSPEALADDVDLLFITAADGREHRALLERVASYRRPTFVDKPFATSSGDAQAMLSLAETHGFPLMSCSALRYCEVLTVALNDRSAGAVLGVDVFGPMTLEPALPGLFWYGCHSIEMIVAAMGVGCREVDVHTDEHTEVFKMTWDDGRVATFRGMREGHLQFGMSLHRETAFQLLDLQTGKIPYYAHMLQAILEALPQGHSGVPSDQMLEIVRIMEAGNRSREVGEPVKLPSLEAISTET